MKLATFAVDTQLGRDRRVGVVVAAGSDPGDDVLADVTTAYAAALAEEGEAAPQEIARAHAPPVMTEFLQRGDRALTAAARAREYVADRLHEGEPHDDDGPHESGPGGGRIQFQRAEVDLLAPIPRPNSLRDCMLFEEHVRNTLGEPPDIWYEQPIYYKSSPDSVVGPGASVVWPDYSEQVDYELEIAAVIGTQARDVSARTADDYIVGYTIFNDFSARDAQLSEMEGRLGPAKGKDFANALGPYLVTADSFEPESAPMTASVNGEVWSEGTPGEMYHSFPEVIEHVSRAETVFPGDVLGSGTVGGGCGLELGRFPQRGDTITLEVAGIGRLETSIV